MGSNLKAVIAAVYSPNGRDPHYHAKISCRQGGVRIRDSYRVNRQEFAAAAGKIECPGCWKHPGYVTDEDLVGEAA